MAGNPLRILVCVRPYTIPVLTEALSGQFNLTFSTTIADAAARLGPHYDIILCGVNFDDSRMFELLQLIKGLPDVQHIPVLCIKVTHSILLESIFDSVKKAAIALSATEFVELHKWRSELGDERAFLKLRDLIQRVCAEPPRKMER